MSWDVRTVLKLIALQAFTKVITPHHQQLLGTCHQSNTQLCKKPTAAIFSRFVS